MGRVQGYHIKYAREVQAGTGYGHLCDLTPSGYVLRVEM